MFTEDLSVFFDPYGFASAATYGGNTVYVIHERQYLEQMNVQTSMPTALGKKSDFSSVAQGQTIVIGAETFTVAEFHHDPPDHPGLTLLLLKV